MCGIYGYVGNVKAKHRKKMVSLIMELGTQTEIRGTDSTGFYAKTAEFEYMEKHSVPASTFYLESETFQEAILAGAIVFIGHNRAASIGEVCNDNAHPFLGENVALVHNGTCSHAKNLLTDAERARMEGSTDSEAIMLYLDREGLETKKYANLSNFSLVAYDRKRDVLYFARDEYKPLVVADLRKEYGVRVFASTVGILNAALERCKIKAAPNTVFSTRADHLYKVSPVDGEVHRLFSFAINPPPTPKKPEVVRRPVQQTLTSTTDYVYKTPSYLNYLTTKNNYHFSKEPEEKKNLIQKALAVFGD